MRRAQWRWGREMHLDTVSGPGTILIGDSPIGALLTLVSRDTREEEFAHHRKLFLTEQGYSYQVVIGDAR